MKYHKNLQIKNFNLGGYVGQVPSKVSDAWQLTGFDERIHGSFSQIAQTLKEQFLSGEDFVYLNDHNDWDSVILTHLAPYGLGSVKFLKSQNDIDKVLELEKRHFGALSGQGLVQTALKNYQKAIDSYIEAHKVHPNMKSPLIMIEKLQKQIKKESI